jgi:hypothetical protein
MPPSHFLKMHLILNKYFYKKPSLFSIKLPVFPYMFCLTWCLYATCKTCSTFWTIKGLFQLTTWSRVFLKPHNSSHNQDQGCVKFRSHLKILGARRAARCKFQTEKPQILGGRL